jgi:hypothetical protein
MDLMSLRSITRSVRGMFVSTSIDRNMANLKVSDLSRARVSIPITKIFRMMGLDNRFVMNKKLGFDESEKVTVS